MNVEEGEVRCRDIFFVILNLIENLVVGGSAMSRTTARVEGGVRIVVRI